MTVINKSVFCRNLDGARLLGHPVYEWDAIQKIKERHHMTKKALLINYVTSAIESSREEKVCF